MRMDEYLVLDGVGMAEAVRRGDVTAEALLELAIGRAEAVNPRINAIITPLYERARSQLRQGLPDGDFTGVPFMLKDLLGALAGETLTDGSAAYADRRVDYSSHLVNAFQETGVNIMAKTNTPEFGLLATTEPKAFGKTSNPWASDRSAGGSSGGSAAAVAAGIVPMASASDGGGSIRIPAACCGLFGLKPSRGLVPTGPVYPEVWDGASAEHILSRSVRDSAVMLDCVVRQDPTAQVPFSPPPGHYRERIKVPPEKLRIGYFCDSPLGNIVDPACRTAVEATAEQLASLGHAVEPTAIPYEGLEVARCYMALYLAHVTAEVLAIEENFGVAYARSHIEPATRMLAAVGRHYPAGAYVRSRMGWGRLRRQMLSAFERFDMILCPVLSEPAPKLGQLRPKAAEELGMTIVDRLHLGGWIPAPSLEKLFLDTLKATPFTAIANLAGLPAMSVPTYWTDEGLPVGVQVIGPYGADGDLLALAAELERVAGGFNRVAMTDR
ncbi:amidase [Mangrovitalea sediminis]|uniref:amidase n=1 Tax=Mangrovitalea sediminis TaxID=1982043 RepID=UPI001304204E|nr:amidase [Mangrovitalea sediminis]